MLQELYGKLPKPMQNEAVLPYLTLLNRKKTVLFFKRGFDLVVSVILIVVLSPFLLGAVIAVKAGSRGPVIYRQTRVGKNGKLFSMYKFRTMVVDAERLGTKVTVGTDDPRITRTGKFLRRTRIDEFPQFFNVLKGDMSLIGPRPEVQQYVDAYEPEYYATLLIRPGITSNTSIAFSNEGERLAGQEDPDAYYIHTLLPEKMELNLSYVRELSLWNDVKIFFATIANVFR